MDVFYPLSLIRRSQRRTTRERGKKITKKIDVKNREQGKKIFANISKNIFFVLIIQ